jgi:hypothetical protein
VLRQFDLVRTSTTRAALVTVVLCAASVPATAATFVVDDTRDLVDAAPGNGFCATVFGTCTLRAAFMEANHRVDGDPADVIRLPPGVYRLTIPPIRRTFPLADDGDLYFGHSQRLDVLGDNPTTTIVEQTTGDRVFQVGGSATVRGITITGGNSADGGAGILNRGDLTLDNVVINGNSVSETACGGGIGTSFYAVTRLTNVAITENRADCGGGVAGGGILDMTFTTVTGNRAVRGGGVFWGGRPFRGAADGLTITRSLISGNFAEAPDTASVPGDGGGLYLSMFGDPWPTEGGVIADTSIRGNVASRQGGGFFEYSAFDSMRFNRILVSGNNAGEGGGATVRGPATLQNSTISENAAAVGGALDLELLEASFRGWLRVVNRVTLLNSTLASNRAMFGSGIDTNDQRFEVFARGTILANEPPEENCSFAGPDSDAVDIDGGSNLDSGTQCHFGFFGISAVDPLLGPLADNGGATWTKALLPGSPAIDAFVELSPEFGVPPCPSNDQRLGVRPAGGACDIGAYESDARMPPKGQLPVPSPFEVLRGRLILDINGAAIQTIAAYGITLAPVGAATGQGATFAFPISGGYLGQRWGQLAVRGGLSIKSGKRQVSLETYVFAAEGDKGYAAVYLADEHEQKSPNGHQEQTVIPLFDLDGVSWGQGAGVAHARLTRSGANFLNARLSTNAFQPGMAIGTLNLDVTMAQPDQNPGGDPLPPPNGP